MVYNIAAESCTVYLDRTCVIGRQKSSAAWREPSEESTRMVPEITLSSAADAEDPQLFSEARRFNMNWRLWHMQNGSRRSGLRKKAEDILESSPKLWETKMEFIASGTAPPSPQPQHSSSAADYFRHVNPESTSQAVKTSELRKVLGSSDPTAVPPPQPQPPPVAGHEEERHLREAFTRYHNQRSLHNRVAFLGDESSMRRFRNLERLEAKLNMNRRRRRQGRIELEQKAETYLEHPPVQRSCEPILFAMPTDPCIYSTNPISAWFLPFALSCTPQSTAREFLADPRACSFSGEVLMRPASNVQESSWQRRWVCVRYNYLFEFLDKEEAMPIGVTCLTDVSCSISAGNDVLELGMFEARITAGPGGSTHATSAPKKAIGVKPHGSHASYLNRLSLAPVVPKLSIAIKPVDCRAAEFLSIVTAAKQLNLDGMYSVNKTRIVSVEFVCPVDYVAGLIFFVCLF